MSDRIDQYPTAVFEGRYGGWFAVAQFDREDVMGAPDRLTFAWTRLHGDDVDYMVFEGERLDKGLYPWIVRGESAADAMAKLRALPEKDKP